MAPEHSPDTPSHDSPEERPTATSWRMNRRDLLLAMKAAAAGVILAGAGGADEQKENIEGPNVRFEDGKFPMRIGYCSPADWKEKQEEIRKNPDAIFSVMKFIEPPGGVIPPGEWMLWLAPSSSWGYSIRGQVSVNNGDQWSPPFQDLTKVQLTKERAFRVRQTEIIPPDNAAIAPYKGGSILVSLMFPVAIVNPSDFKGKEELRSTAMFVAKYGERSVAEDLAKFAKENMGKLNNGNARGRQQISVTFQVNGDGTVSTEQAQGTEEELTAAIEAGIRSCGEKKLRIGTTFSEQVQKAKGLLEKKR